MVKLRKEKKEKILHEKRVKLFGPGPVELLMSNNGSQPSEIDKFSK
jgi:hypothetical protein